MPSPAPFPTLSTARLTLRGFTLADARDVQRLAGERAIAETTLLIPHPYPDGAAESWISTHAEAWEQRRAVAFAITDRANGALLGAIGLGIEPAHAAAELGYWIAVPAWGRGYATEAARAVVDFGFRELHLNRVHARYFTRNPASGRVLAKVGFRPEGLSPQAVRRFERFEDIAFCGVLQRDWPGIA
jgi:RimJ/RimL family protein N-acetyltransferase